MKHALNLMALEPEVREMAKNKPQLLKPLMEQHKQHCLAWFSQENYQCWKMAKTMEEYDNCGLTMNE